MEKFSLNSMKFSLQMFINSKVFSWIKASIYPRQWQNKVRLMFCEIKILALEIQNGGKCDNKNQNIWDTKGIKIMSWEEYKNSGSPCHINLHNIKGHCKQNTASYIVWWFRRQNSYGEYLSSSFWYLTVYLYCWSTLSFNSFLTWTMLFFTYLTCNIW